MVWGSLEKGYVCIYLWWCRKYLLQIWFHLISRNIFQVMMTVIFVFPQYHHSVEITEYYCHHFFAKILWKNFTLNWFDEKKLRGSEFLVFPQQCDAITMFLQKFRQINVLPKNFTINRFDGKNLHGSEFIVILIHNFSWNQLMLCIYNIEINANEMIGFHLLRVDCRWLILLAC